MSVNVSNMDVDSNPKAGKNYSGQSVSVLKTITDKLYLKVMFDIFNQNI